MNDKHLADVLHWRRAGVLAHLPQPIGARLAIVAQYADLDQLVGFQGALDFRQNRGRKPVIADHDHGFQRVCLGLERTPYRRHQLLHARNSISRRLRKPLWP